MPQKRDSSDKGVKFLQLKKIATLIDLTLHLQCSARTVQRRLADCKAIHSYNHNGRYYTLPEIAKFDSHGLWKYRDVFFSRYGNLPETFVALVRNSPTGLTAAEAGDLLGVRPSSFLWSLRNHPELKREKHQNLYVYLAAESGLYAEQKRQRTIATKMNRTLTDAESIAILVEKIKQPSLTDVELSRRLSVQNLRIEPETIESFFTQLGLPVKKKPRLH